MQVINIAVAAAALVCVAATAAVVYENIIVYRVHRLLSAAGINRGDFDKALALMRRLFAARELLFLSSDEKGTVVYPNDPHNAIVLFISDDKDFAHELSEYSRRGKRGTAVTAENVERSRLGSIRFMHRNSVKRFVAVPAPEGVFVLVDPVFSVASRLRLSRFAYSFSCAAHTMRYIDKMKITSETDALTGLPNRASFERRTHALRRSKPSAFACIYFDINGLHRVNNTYGHERGDRMICHVADELAGTFGNHNVYRIGGDEFVVFPRETEDTALRALTDAVVSRLSACDYFVSAGISTEKECSDIDKAISEAEHKMYENKREFYLSHASETR